MTAKDLQHAARLLRSYANACDNILYKHGDHTQDQMDAEELADKLDNFATDEGRGEE
jgi:hypothetical protein